MKKFTYDSYWPGFKWDDYFITKILKSLSCEYTESLNDADVIFSGPFSDGLGRGYNSKLLKYRGRKKLCFVTHEPVVPNLRLFDFSISFDPIDYQARNLRVPYWRLYYDKEINSINTRCILKENYLKYKRNFSDFEKRKDAVVAIIGAVDVNRIMLLDELSKIIPVHLYGKAVGKPIENKFEIFSSYKYVFCPENTISRGYVTEKIPDAYYSGCLPISYVDTMQDDFNQDAFLNLAEINSTKNSFNRVRALVRNVKLQEKIYNNKLFDNNTIINDINLFLFKIIS